MKLKFDVTGAIEKLAGFNKAEGGKGNIDAHFELEFSAEELGMVYEAQRTMLPELLNFIKELKKEEDNKMSDLEKSRLESKIEGLEIQLNGERERHSNTKRDRDEYFDKYIKMLDENTQKRKESIERLKKENEDLRKSLGIEDEEESDLI